MTYIGRFAPSPSGPLHFGSLVAALGSYFQAKHNHGLWLVRMEDLDPPREVKGAAKLILQALEHYQLFWDSEVIYQSQRHTIYQQQIDKWLDNQQAYYCQCSRKQIKQNGGFYQGTCRQKNVASTGNAIRLVMQHPTYQFQDKKHGIITIPPQLANEDFIIKRRDGLFAYNLAVVIDDIEQNITEVVRGADLIEPTGRQISLYQTLGKHSVSYLHLPLALDSKGNKLSKQNHAQPIDIKNVKPTLLQAMLFLGFVFPKDIEQGSVKEILQWGCENWSISALSAKSEIMSPFSNEHSQTNNSTLS
ncbi:tRNA glutamyl-Q(34) synthetase GluQRS [Vibrio sp. 99-8-1]|uniref:tRNA glutamyl-Q(34) synthetase GluQRS n=1 Tax=Vibrio sp. 99-8-1 TaxID=2607602 RepID=UPI001493776D|nr:tRNA glutamyl-Q(34) synthetase GluQRS [Vibrio sp. 99-8-1]NOI66188.1 tRNA glutamyl-Q(34) synthetase GluQRS [Vibrio sp. 99-8-1]